LAIVAAYFGYLNGSLDPMSYSRFIQLHLSGTILSSTAEEVIMRGGVLTALSQTRFGKKMIGSLSAGNIIQALAFASLHILAFIKLNLPLQEAAIYFLVLTIGGLVFGYVYQRTANLWNCIFMHILWNLGAGP
jgi:membrane protease YdiL (CAAX protease family)